MSKKKVKQRSSNAFLEKMRKKTEYKIKQQEAFEEQRQAKEKHRLETEGCEIMYISTLHPDHGRRETKVFVGEESDGVVLVKDSYFYRRSWFTVEKKYLITLEQLDKELENERLHQKSISRTGTQKKHFPFVITALAMASMYGGNRKL